MNIIFFTLLIIIGTAGLSRIAYLDSIKIASANAIVTMVFRTPGYVVGNWDGGGREERSGTIDKIVFFKNDEPILSIPNGDCKNISIGPSLFESKETFSQMIFPKPIQIKDVKNSSSILFKVLTLPYGQVEIQSGTIEVSLNDTKMSFQIPAQTTIEDPKDKNSSFVSVILPH